MRLMTEKIFGLLNQLYIYDDGQTNILSLAMVKLNTWCLIQKGNKLADSNYFNNISRILFPIQNYDSYDYIFKVIDLKFYLIITWLKLNIFIKCTCI